MPIDIGSEGLAEVNLTIPQGTNLVFSVVHTDEEGKPVDHTNSIIASVVQNAKKETVVDLSAYCTGTKTGIDVAIPASISDYLNVGRRYFWDMIVTTSSGSIIRMCYGVVFVVDTYALDE